MKKTSQKGFMLLETLVVTTFIAGVFIFLYIQFTNLNKSYKFSFQYDTVEGQYALKDVVDYLKEDNGFVSNINSYMMVNDYLNITNCNSGLYLNIDYCNKLFELENISEIIVSNKDFKPTNNNKISENIKEYYNKVNKKNTNNFNYFIVMELKDGSVISKYINF